MYLRQKDLYGAVDTPYVEIREVLRYPPTERLNNGHVLGHKKR